MIIIWQGKGWLVAAIIFGCALAANLLTNLLTGSPDYWDKNTQPPAGSLLIAGVICWFWGVRLEEEQARTVVNEKTGEGFTLHSKHTFFWIPMKWCGVITILASVGVFANQVLTKPG